MLTWASRARKDHHAAYRIADEIVGRADLPPGAAPIPRTDQGLYYLVMHLVQGLPVADAESLLADAPEIVKRGLEEADLYEPEMWQGWRLTRWRKAQAKLKALREEETKAVASTSAASEHKRRELEERLKDNEEMLERYARGELTPWEQHLVDRGQHRVDPNESAAKLARIREARACCQREGRTWTLEELEQLR